MERNAEGFVLPQVQSDLAPFIRSRKEVTRIRRCLRLRLESRLESPDGAFSSLTTLNTKALVKARPTEVSGLQRQYLEALSSNTRAQKEYESLFQNYRSVGGKPHVNGSRREKHGSVQPASSLESYLELLRERREHERLRILQDYLNAICIKAPAQSDFFDGDEMFHDLEPPIDSPRRGQDEQLSTSSSECSGVDDLMSRLEKAVLRSQHLLDREKRRLEELGAAGRGNVPSRDGAVQRSQWANLEALSKTRDELIYWVESQLEETDNAPNVAPPRASSHVTIRDTGPVRRDVGSRYRDYVEARTRAAAWSIRATLDATICDPDCNVQLDQVLQEAELSKETNESSILAPYATQLLSQSQAQRSLALQKTHTLANLSWTRRTTLQALDRLADESHLLPAYPYLANEPRFKHAASVFTLRATDRKSPLGPGAKSLDEDECSRKARSWAFAATSAETTTKGQLEKSLEGGKKRSDRANEILDDLFVELNNETEPAAKAGSDSSDEDLWARGGPEKGRRRNKKIHTASRGPWKGLDGQVGVFRKVPGALAPAR